MLPVGAKTLVTETAHLDVTFSKIASGAKHAPTESSTAMFNSDEGEYDDNDPGLSRGTAFKGCQKPCWLNNRSQNKTTQNIWSFQVEITVFEHDCKAPAGCKLSHAWTGKPGLAITPRACDITLTKNPMPRWTFHLVLRRQHRSVQTICLA